MKRKICAILLAAMLTLSFAACNNGSGNENSNAASTASTASTESVADTSAAGTDESKAESDTESKAEESSKEAEESKADANTDNERAEQLQKLLESDQLGPKTKNALSILANKTLSLCLKMNTIPDMTEESASTESMMSMLESIKLSVVTDGVSSRTVMDMGFIKADILKTADETYYMDESTKTAMKMSGDDSGSGMSMGMDVDSMIDTSSLEEGSFTYTGAGEETLEGKTYSTESYKIKASAAQLAELAQSSESSSTETESTLVIYFDGDDIKFLSSKSAGATVTVTFEEISTEIDASKLTLPSDYTVTDYSPSFGTDDVSIDLSDLDISFGEDETDSSEE